MQQVIYVPKCDSRLSNNDLPLYIQKLRCRTLYYALKFSPTIENLGKVLFYWFASTSWQLRTDYCFMSPVFLEREGSSLHVFFFLFPPSNWNPEKACHLYKTEACGASQVTWKIHCSSSTLWKGHVIFYRVYIWSYSSGSWQAKNYEVS